jgi:ribonuclease HIII
MMKMLVVGIDENGLGPELGPLVVTATLISVKNLEPLLRGSLKESKQIFRSGEKMGEGEDIVLSFFSFLKGYIPSHPREIFNKLLLTLEDTCDSPLPHCNPDFEIPNWCDKSQIRKNTAELFLKEVGGELIEVKSIALCPAQLNNRLQSYNKNHIDYLLFEELIMYFKGKYKDEILFLCGGIGTTKDYSFYFRHLKALPYKSLRREEEVTYFFPSLGEIRFIKNGDEKYFPIALSSLFGKYIRELFIEQMNRFFRANLPSLPYCSGYRDRKTKEFIENSEKLREKLKIPKVCFLRFK